MTHSTFKGLLAVAFLATAIAGPLAHGEERIEPVNEIFEPRGQFSSREHLKVAVIQWAPDTAPLTSSATRAQQTKRRNREELAQFIREAAGKGAKLIIASELAAVGYPDIPELPSEDDNFRSKEDVAPFAERVPGPSTRFFGDLAKSLNVFIQYGDVEVEGDQYYNIAVAVSPTGEVLGKHRKNLLFKLENEYFTPGDSGTTYETPAGKVGMLICADVYHSPLLRAYRGKVDILALTTSWAQMNTGWGYFTSAARSVGAWLLAANQPYYPDSGVIDPRGNTQSHIRQTTVGIAYGYVPLARAKR